MAAKVREIILWPVSHFGSEYINRSVNGTLSPYFLAGDISADIKHNFLICFA